MSLFHAGIAPALDTNGNPISGAVWEFTRSGTTTPVAVHADADFSTSLGSTVEADSAGRFVDIYTNDAVALRARLWLDDTLTGTPIKDIDPVNGTTALGYVTEEQFGGGEDGLQAALEYAADNGVGEVHLVGNPTTLNPDNVVFTNWATQPSNVGPGVKIDASGTLLRGGNASGDKRCLDFHGSVVSRHTITAAFSAGATQIPLNNTTGLVAGDWVVVRAGDIPTDTPETTNWLITRLTSVDSSTQVTLSEGMRKALSAPDLAAAVNNKFLWKIEPITNEADTDFTFDPDEDSVAGVTITLGVAPHIKSIRGRHIEGGLLDMQYVRDFLVDDHHISDNTSVLSNQGGGARIAECTGTYLRYRAENVIGPAFAAEAGSRAHFVEFSDFNTSGTARDIMLINSDSHVTADLMTLRGKGGQNLCNAVDAPVSTYRTRALHILTDTMPNSCGSFGANVTDDLVIELGGTGRETYSMARARWQRLFIPLANSISRDLAIAPANHFVAAINLYASASVDLDALSTVNLYRASSFSSLTLATSFEVGEWKSVSGAGAIGAGNDHNAHRDEALRLNCITAAIGGSVSDVSGEYLIVEVLVVPDLEKVGTGLTYSEADALVVAGQQDVKVLTDAATVTPDFGANRDFEWTMGGSRTLANPVGRFPGQTGTIRIAQDGTGSRIITYGSDWRFPGGSASGGVLTTTASAVDMIRYQVASDLKIYATLDKAFAA